MHCLARSRDLRALLISTAIAIALFPLSACQTRAPIQKIKTSSDANVASNNDPTIDDADCGNQDIVIRVDPSSVGLLHLHLISQQYATHLGMQTASEVFSNKLPIEVQSVHPFRSAEIALEELREPLSEYLGDTSDPDRAQKARDLIEEVAHSDVTLSLFYVRVSDTRPLDIICAELETLPQVEYAHPVETYVVQQSSSSDTAFMWHFDRVNALGAWQMSTRVLQSVRVGVVDTGVRGDHKDLVERLVDPVDVYLCNGDSYADEDPKNDDKNGHGTACAGLIGAIRDNNVGIAGMAQAAVSIIPVNAAAGPNSIAHYEDGVLWCIRKGARVVNLSFGKEKTAPNKTELLMAAEAQNRGVLLVAAAGNSDASTDQFYPAALPGVVGVSATNIKNYRVTKRHTSGAWGSNYGKMVDLCAPGYGPDPQRGWDVHIASLDRSSKDARIFTWGGTSMAAPHVSGLAALILQNVPGLNAADVAHAMMCSATDLVGDPTEDSAGPDVYHGCGLINAPKALQVALGNLSCEHGVSGGTMQDLTD